MTNHLTLDDILEVCSLWGTDWETWTKEDQRHYLKAFKQSPNYKESKQQLSALLGSIIGEDVEQPDYNFADYKVIKHADVDLLLERNELRAEQRSRAKEAGFDT